MPLLGERVHLTKAAKLCGRSPITLRDWVTLGHLNADRPGPFPDWYVDVDDLLNAAQEQMRRYRERPIAPGPGRGHIGEPAGRVKRWDERSHGTGQD